LDAVIVRLVAAGELHQRDQVRGIVGVSSDAALRVKRLGHDIGDQQAGGAAGVQGVRGGILLHLRQNGALDLDALRAALLNELGVLHRLLHGGGGAHAGNDLVLAGGGDGVVGHQCVQTAEHLVVALGQLLVVDVVEGDVQALQGILDGPAGADDAAADTGDILDIRNVHTVLLQRTSGGMPRISRASAGVAG